MTADEILTIAKAGGIVLEVRGDTLHVDAPRGALTPEFRQALLRHKPELLTRLSPVTEFVYLRGGLTVPLAAALTGDCQLQRRRARGRAMSRRPGIWQRGILAAVEHFLGEDDR